AVSPSPSCNAALAATARSSTSAIADSQAQSRGPGHPVRQGPAQRHQTKLNKKKRLSRGRRLRRFGDSAGRTDRGIRSCAFSDSKTEVWVAIFPNACAVE